MKINPTSVGIVKRVPNQKVGLMEKGGQKGGTFLPSTHTDTRSTTPTTPTPTPGGGWRGGGGGGGGGMCMGIFEKWCNENKIAFIQTADETCES